MKPGLKRCIRLVLAILCCISVFFTSYALRLSAITAESPVYCGLEEHIHNEGCYGPKLICGRTEHRHTDSCFMAPLPETAAPEGREEQQHEPWTEAASSPAFEPETTESVNHEPEFTESEAAWCEDKGTG